MRITWKLIDKEKEREKGGFVGRLIEFRYVILALSADTQGGHKGPLGLGDSCSNYVFSRVLFLSLSIFSIFLGGFQKILQRVVMDFYREVPFSGEYPQEKVPSTACSKLGGLSAGSLDDLFSTQNMVSALPLSSSPFLSMIRADEVLLFSVCTCNTRSTCHGMGAFSLSLSASFNFFWVFLFYIFSLVQVSERETLSFSGLLFSHIFMLCLAFVVCLSCTIY